MPGQDITLTTTASWNPFGFSAGCSLKATELPVMSKAGGFTIITDNGITMESISSEGGVYYVKVLDVDGKLHSGVFPADKFVLV
jgi:hypothetical protein